MPPIPTVCHHGRVGTSGDGLSDGGVLAKSMVAPLGEREKSEHFPYI